MKTRLGKAVEIADMVVMQMREDHILDRVRVNAEETERLHRTAQEGALAPLRDFGVEAGVDDKRSPAAARDPDEVIHRHRPIMRIATDEMRGAARVTGGVADGKE